MKPFLIIETGKPVPSLKRHGGFPDWIRVASGLHVRDVKVCNVAEGEKLPDAKGFSGVFITGSGAMVTERLDWSERSAEWLNDAAHREHSIFGICYGHQLLAQTLGGKVDYNPKGREMGTIKVSLKANAQEDVVFAGLPTEIQAQATHMQTVLQAPENAEVLAHSELDDCQAFRWKQNVWGVQFHPEFSTEHMREYIHVRRMALIQEGKQPKAMRKAVSASSHARQVLKNFVQHAVLRAS
jgi:GMP synthase (glutamine-hydrolysing)